jgi:hypothetical protein
MNPAASLGSQSAGVIGLALLLLAWIEPYAAHRHRRVSARRGLDGWHQLVPAPDTVGVPPHLMIDGSVLLIGGILLAATQGQ